MLQFHALFTGRQTARGLTIRARAVSCASAFPDARQTLVTETPAERSAAGPGMLAAVARHPGGGSAGVPAARAGRDRGRRRCAALAGLGWDQPAGANMQLQCHPTSASCPIVTDGIRVAIERRASTQHGDEPAQSL